MSKLLFKMRGYLFKYRAVLWAAALLIAPSIGYAEGGKTYRLNADIIQCLNEAGLKEEATLEQLADINPLQDHPACGNLKARVIARIDLPLQHKRTKIWNNLKNVSIVGKAYEDTFEEGKGFVFSVADKPTTSIRTGVEVKAYLDASDRKKPILSMLVKHYSTDETAEEMVITSEGKTYLNPYPREVVRMVRIHTPVTFNEEDIWGGQGVFQGVAPMNIPHLFPENARLWVSGKIAK